MKVSGYLRADLGCFCGNLSGGKLEHSSSYFLLIRGPAGIIKKIKFSCTAKSKFLLEYRLEFQKIITLPIRNFYCCHHSNHSLLKNG